MAASPIISVENIEKNYDLGDVKVKALRGVTLTINRGDFLCITGRNGSGKSTLLHQLGLLDLPTAGKIYLDHQEVVKMSERQRSYLRLTYLGYIFQEYALVPELTAIENVMLPAMMQSSIKDSRKKAEELLRKVGLEKKSHHLPKQCSGGEQQKIAIARALVNNPEIIFADEPTASLDSVVSKDIINIFKKLNHDDGSTVIMITHEDEETRFANKIIKLSDGKIA
jgi:putative ABC transport system ATP-binding protein